jgi:hypothetical protein
MEEGHSLSLLKLQVSVRTRYKPQYLQSPESSLVLSLAHAFGAKTARKAPGLRQRDFSSTLISISLLVPVKRINWVEIKNCLEL